MKNPVLMITIFTVIVHSYCPRIFAQENQPATLLENARWNKIGYMISPNFGYTKIDRADVLLLNFRGGLVIKDKFGIGGFFNFSVNEFVPKSETIPEIYMDYKTFGGFFEYTIFSNKLVHASFPLLIGGGEIEMDADNFDPNLGEDHFFLIEPGALLEINIHDYVRFNIGFTYRFIENTTYRSMNQSSISGFAGQIGFKFGWFRN